MKIEFENIRCDSYRVFLESQNIGTISFHQNKFHASTCHFNMNLSTYDVKVAQEFGEGLAVLLQKPLQIMLDADEREEIRFLEAAGFRCKRKCYEAEVASKDLIKKILPDLTIRECHAGENMYLACTQLLYRYYQDTHEVVSPLTASFLEFSEEVPKTVYYMQKTGAIEQAIFIDQNELAYCCSTNVEKFGDFAAAVLGEMYSRYSTVFFEADDCDPAAMSLLALFQINLQSSYNTYIREETEMQ